MRWLSSNALNIDDVNKIKLGTAVKAVAPFTDNDFQVVWGSGSTSTQISGTTESYEIIKNDTMAREIGIRKAIGAQGKDILMQFLILLIWLSSFHYPYKRAENPH